MNGESKSRLEVRRRLLGALGAWLAALGARAQSADREPGLSPYDRVVPGRELRFPRDHGSHPDFRVEWWYVTGLLAARSTTLGFQITFFRARPGRNTVNPSRFTPRQVLIGHAALTDPHERRLLHQQRIARAGFGLVEALEGRTSVWIDRWRLEQTDAAYRMRLPLDGFGFDFELRATQPPMLNGDAGFSRKGARPESASYYYSMPQLQVNGMLLREGREDRVTGKAWLDHEWSSNYLDERAQGWDWMGMNLDDGAALMAFRIRGRDGGTFWAGATLRTRDGVQRTFEPGEIGWTPLREWRSARTGTRYPVAWRVRIAGIEYEVQPLLDDQEQDARASTGTVYWEGACELLQNGRRVGAGYLELTGYWRRLKV